jgi:hypothetical protein
MMLDSQNYAIALPLDNTILVPLDISLLDTLRSEWRQQTCYRYLDRDATN